MNEMIPFVGRSEELELFTDLLNSDGSHLLWVQGPGGVGKTWLLNEMSRRVLARTDIKSAFIDYYSTQHHYISGLYSAIISQLGEKSFSSFTQINQELEQLRNVGFSLDLISLQQERRDGAFIDCYNELETKTKILLLFDTIEIVQTQDSEIFQWILNQFLPNIKNTLVVISSRASLKSANEPKNINTSLVSLRGFSSEEAEVFFKINNFSLDSDLFRKLLDLTRGQPVLLSLALDYISRSFPFDLEETDRNVFEKKLVQSLADIDSPLGQIILLLSQADQGIDANLFKYLISRGVIDWEEGKIESTLNELSHFSFVKTRPGGELSLHDSMRELIRSYVWPEVDPDRSIRRLWNDSILTYRNEVLHSFSAEEYEYEKIKALLIEQLLHQGHVDKRFLRTKNLSIGGFFQRFTKENTEFDTVYDGEREVLALAKKSSVQKLSEQWKILSNHAISKSQFKKISTQMMQGLANVLGESDIFATPSASDDADSIVFHLKTDSVFKGIRLPSQLPIIIQRCTSFGEKELNYLYGTHLNNRLDSRMAILITFIDDNDLEETQKLLEHKIRQVYAYDIILVGYKDLVFWAAAKKPSDFLRRLLLSRVDLTAVSPFVTTGIASDDIFFGREHELREIIEHVNLVNYALVGGRRIGKTSILKRLERVRLPSVGFNAFYHDCSYTPTQEELVRSIVTDKTWFDQPPTGPIKTFVDVARTLPNDKPLVILLDEADKLIQPDRVTNYSLFSAFRALASAGYCHFVLSGEQSLRTELTNTNSPLYNFGNELLIGRLDFHAIEELVTRPIRQLEIEMVNESGIVQSIWGFTSGHPNIVQRLCQRLIIRLNQRSNRQLTLKDVEAIVADPDFLRRDFLNVYWERAAVLERLCSLLMAADSNVRTLIQVRESLFANGIEVTLNQVDDALERLVDLRNILQRTPEGYEFAVTAFPEVIARTARLNDLVALNREIYQEHGDVEPRSRRGVT